MFVAAHLYLRKRGWKRATSKDQRLGTPALQRASEAFPFRVGGMTQGGMQSSFIKLSAMWKEGHFSPLRTLESEKEASEISLLQFSTCMLEFQITWPAFQNGTDIFRKRNPPLFHVSVPKFCTVCPLAAFADSLFLFPPNGVDVCTGQILQKTATLFTIMYTMHGCIKDLFV